MPLLRYFRRARWDEERARELEDYIAHEIDENLARGMGADEARFAAHRRLGNVTRIREDIYDMNTLGWLDALWQDLRYACRLLLKQPIFAAVAIVTLALGTGANAAIFQLLDAVRLRTLPVERPEELVSVGVDMNGVGRVGIGYSGRAIHTEPLWQALRRDQQAFRTMLAWGTDRWDLSTDGEFRPASGLYVSGSYFDALGVRPHLGRVINERDDQKGCGSPAAVLSHGFWQSHYGGSPAAVGQTIALNRQPFTIVGVTPPPFFGVEVGRTFDVAIPLCAEPALRGALAGTGRPNVWWLDVMGRLSPGWTAERAGAHLAAISPAIFNETVYDSYNTEFAANYRAFRFNAAAAPTGVSNLRTQYATQLWVLLGATALVLLITCANLANLMIARATTRTREMAVRLAIGASRGRVLRQLLVESAVIAALGAAFGLLVAGSLSQWLLTSLSTDVNPLFVDLKMDWRVIGFMIGMATLACVLFGLSPALRATAANPARAMQPGGRSSTEGREAFAARRGLVVAQVALSTVLVVGALLFARSLRNLSTIDVGFNAEGIVTSNVDLSYAAIPEPARRATFARVLERIRSTPGVRSVAESFIVPMSRIQWNGPILIAGSRQSGVVNFNAIGDEYFSVMQTPIVMGRMFDARDSAASSPAAIVNESFARRYFPGQTVLGQTFQVEAPPGEPAPTYQIVGLVKDTKYRDLREDFSPIAYLAFAQQADLQPFLDVVIRTDMPLSAVTAALTQDIVDAVPGASVSHRTITQFVERSLVTDRLMASLSALFGALAVAIATVGLYGVVSYMVTRRRAEIGVRLALGAEPASVVRMVLRESGALLLLGAVAGVALAVVLSRYVASLLYAIDPWDVPSFATAVGLLGAVSLVAAWLPARRAARLSPTVALRE
jgi:predicted permease